MAGAPWLATHYFNDTAGTAAQAVTAVGTFWGAIDAFMDSEVDWTTGTEVETVDPVTGNVTAITSVTAATGSGALAVESLPRAAQGLIRWRTGDYIAGREIRGRTFIPGLAESTNDNGDLSAATVAAFNAAASALIADANSVLDIWSRKNAVARAVVTGSTWSQYAVMRSRRD